MILKKARVYSEFEETSSHHVTGDFSVTLQEGLINIQPTNLVPQLLYLLTSELDPYRPNAKRKNHKNLTNFNPLKSNFFFFRQLPSVLFVTNPHASEGDQMVSFPRAELFEQLVKCRRQGTQVLWRFEKIPSKPSFSKSNSA